MKQASNTAIGVAALRAAHQLIDGEPKLLDDPVIVQLFGPEFPAYIEKHPERFSSWVRMALRSHVLLRSRYAEDCLKEAYDRGVRQYLVAGAGLDTFAYRQPSWAHDLHIYEADHPASQAHKKGRLSDANIAIPDNLRFVPVDFDAGDIAGSLRSAGFDLKAPAFISCLGVLMYLKPETVDRLFQFIATLPPTSEFVFTFARKQILNGPFSLAKKAARVGEPWLSRFRNREIVDKLEGLGFSWVSFLSPEEATRLYFRNRADKLPPPRRTYIVRAIL